MTQPAAQPPPATTELTPGAPPRIASVFIAYGCALAGVLILSTLLVVASLVVRIFKNPGLLARPERIEAELRRFVESADGVSSGVGVSALVLLTVAALGARLLPRPTGDGLRLGPARVSPVVAIGMIAGPVAVGTLANIPREILGSDEAGSLAIFERALANGRPASLAIAVIIIGIVAPIGEELFFRGFMQTRLRVRWSPRVAVVITAVAFGVVHMDRWHTPIALLIGLWLGWMTEVTGSIRPAIAAHVFNNLLSTLTAIAGLRQMGAVSLASSAVALALGLWAVYRAPRGAPDEPMAGPRHPALPVALGALLVACAGSVCWALARA